MDISRFQRYSEETAVYPRDVGLYYVTLGLAGEAGELANKVKKIIRDDDGKLNSYTRELLADELGDVLWYVAAVASEIDMSLSDIATDNVNKLHDRKRRGKLHGSGDKR